jgi:hypothetical protein
MDMAARAGHQRAGSPRHVLSIKRPGGLCWLNLGEPCSQDRTADLIGTLGITPDNREDTAGVAGDMRTSPTPASLLN